MHQTCRDDFPATRFSPKQNLFFKGATAARHGLRKLGWMFEPNPPHPLRRRGNKRTFCASI